MGDQRCAAYDGAMDRNSLEQRARALWPKHIDVESAKRKGDTVTVTSKPMLDHYPSRLVLVVRDGQAESDMTQLLPDCPPRTWSLADSEMPRALKRQWAGILAQMPKVS